MKKHLYSLIVLTVLLFATSCAESDSSHEVEMTFRINLQDGASARSIGDGTSAIALLYEIRQAGKVVSKRTIADAFAEGLSYSLTVNVIEDSHYEYIFWAQKPDAPYGTEDLSSIEMNYEDTPANDEGGYRTKAWTENKKYLPFPQSEMDATASTQYPLTQNNY